MNWQSAEPSPALFVPPPAAVSLDEAHAAIEQWEFYSGKTLDSTQRLSVEVMMAENAEGRWAARTTGREMPRQNGKGDEIEVVEFWGLTQRGEAILHTAHKIKTASNAHGRLAALLENNRDLRPKIKKILNGLGQQQIETTIGGVCAYETRTSDGGRGLDDISRLVVDEAQHAQPEQLASSTPTLLANPNPQQNFVGTGGIGDISGWWWNIRIRALKPDGSAFGYVGHTADHVEVDDDGKVKQHPIDATDRALWVATNPALSSGRADFEFFEEQLRNLGPAIFAREHLGVWDPPPVAGGGGGPIDLARWSALATDGGLIDPDSTPDPSRCRIAIDTNPERTWFTWCIAGHRHDGLIHGESTGSHNDKSQAVARAVGVAAKLGVPVTCSDAALAADIETAGGTADLMKTAEQAAATAALIDATRGEAPLLRHRGEPALRRALELAQTKPYSDGGITWSRRSTTGDISPLTALTMAFGRLGVDVKKPHTPFVVFS
jgi:hypothetical protein